MASATLARVREAFLRSVLLRLAPARLAPANFARDKRARCNTAPARLAPDSSAPDRSLRLSAAFCSAQFGHVLVRPARKSASPCARTTAIGRKHRPDASSSEAAA